MDPKTLSASAIDAYENCPAGYNAQIISKIPERDGDAAVLGSFIHEVLEVWVRDGHYCTAEPTTFEIMEEIASELYYNYFTDESARSEALEILANWYLRQDWEGREVISTEVKSTFEIPTSRGPLPITYIWDRADDLSGGERTVIEVVDYKSYRTPIKVDDLKNLIQVRVYACAANVQFPEAQEIWVSFDYVRYGEPVSVKFTRDENVETWNYLRAVAERIYADDGTKERLNSKCHWCPRRFTCETLQSNIKLGGEFALTTDFDEAVERYGQLKAIQKSTNNMLDGLKEYIFEEMENRGLVGNFETERSTVKLKSKKIRNANTRRVATIIGPELFLEHASLSMKDIDNLLKPGVLDDETRQALEGAITTTRGTPWLEVNPKNEE